MIEKSKLQCRTVNLQLLNENQRLLLILIQHHIRLIIIEIASDI